MAGKERNETFQFPSSLFFLRLACNDILLFSRFLFSFLFFLIACNERTGTERERHEIDPSVLAPVLSSSTGPFLSRDTEIIKI